MKRAETVQKRFENHWILSKKPQTETRNLLYAAVANTQSPAPLLPESLPI